MRKRKQNKLTKHHIIPSSRGGKTTLENICYVSNQEHQKYHNLFINKTPHECLKYLTDVFWNKDKRYIDTYWEQAHKKDLEVLEGYIYGSRGF